MFRAGIYRLPSWLPVSVLLFGVRLASAHAQRPIEARDCVTVRYLAVDNSGQRAILMNPQGTRVVYLVKVPDLRINENLFELFAADLNDGGKPRLLLTGRELGQLQWLQDGVHLEFLYRNRAKRRAIYKVNTETGSLTPIIQFKDDIVEFSSDSHGATIAFAAENKSEGFSGKTNHTAEEIDSGYRIPFSDPQHTDLHYRRIYVARKHDQHYRAEPLPIKSPFDHTRLISVPYLGTLHLSLSPDGQRLLVNYIDTTEALPSSWLANKYVQRLRQVGFAGVLPTVLVSIANGRSALALNSPWISNTPLWSSDSRRFAVYAESPIGTEWERNDEAAKQLGSAGAHLFSVEIANAQIKEVSPRMTDGAKQPLFWSDEGNLVLRTSATTLSIFQESSSEWRQISSFELPLKDYFRFSEIASNGSTVMGDYQNSYTPPQIYSFKPGDTRVSILTKLNPQFDGLTLAPAKPVQWSTSTGYKVEGFLFVPPGYKDGDSYPLVIQTKAYEGQFACDTGYNHYPSFAPQPIANAGMMYLVRTYPPDWKESDEVKRYPSGYPGGIAEAAFQMDIWDGAVNQLAAQGLIDPKRVGLIGFSRTGWYTEFILTHSHIPYRAATLTDNVQYNLPEYWSLRTPSTLRGWDAMYGGPPYGDSLKSWVDYSASFHLDQVHAAVLMESMGYGIQFDDPKRPPLYLSTTMDWLTGLTRLNRAVELYYYPNEDHQPDHPKARLASLQRNVDWYRFWLKGSRRQDVLLKDQYERWEMLRQKLDSAR